MTRLGLFSFKANAMTYRGPDKPYVMKEGDREREQRYWDVRDKGGIPLAIPSSLVIKNGEGIDMTCRLELEFKGQAYPKSCPTCGLGGRCKNGYTQIKNEAQTGYSIQSPSGQINYYSASGKVTQSVGAVGITGASFPPQPEPIPDGVYWNLDNFYEIATKRGMGHNFWIKWRDRFSEFPRKPDDEPQPVPNSGPMSLHKRLKLMVYLQETFKINSEAELFERVGEIERLTRD